MTTPSGHRPRRAVAYRHHGDDRADADDDAEDGQERPQQVAADLAQGEEEGVEEHVSINKKENTLQLEATNHQFMAFIKDSEGKAVWAIDRFGLVQQITEHPHE